MAPAVHRTPTVIARADHPISRRQLSPNALRVLYRLHEAGHQAFLVGGCVRDAMLGRVPKDFDVATDALPEQVRKLFRNCRLVGRRFRLAHIVYGDEIIEVATFRASSAPPDEPADDHEDDDADDVGDTRGGAGHGNRRRDEPESSPSTTGHRVQDASGRILRDNVYGTIDDDVWRRDFACNALYYNIADFSVWDYTDGVADIAARQLRLIGDPETRYREDPVRMLRAARFEAKLGFSIEARSAAPLPALKHLLAGVPAARLFDEVGKLFLTGHGVASLEVLLRRDLLVDLLPPVAHYLQRHRGGVVEKLLRSGLASTDERYAADKPCSPTYLFALLFYGPIAAIIETMPPERWHQPEAIGHACDRAIREVLPRVSVPRRISQGMHDIYALQPRLEQPRGRRALRMLELPRFRAAYDLLLLRAECGLASVEIARWWTGLQAAPPEEREQMAEQLARTRPAQADDSAGEGAGDGAKRPRRRRGGRRRRRPGGQGAE